MFITKKGLSRRTILRGMGAGLALPQWTLDESAAQPAKPWRYPQE